MNNSPLSATGVSMLLLLSQGVGSFSAGADFQPRYAYIQEIADKYENNSTYSYNTSQDSEPLEEVADIILESPNMTYEKFLDIDQSNWF